MKAAGQIAMQARHSNGTDMSSRDVEAIARALDAERAKAAEIAENPYSDAVSAIAGDEPLAVGRKIAAAIRRAAEVRR